MVSDYRKHGEFTAPVNFMFRRIGVGDPDTRPPRNLVFKVHPDADAALEETLVARLQALAQLPGSIHQDHAIGRASCPSQSNDATPRVGAVRVPLLSVAKPCTSVPAGWSMVTLAFLL